MELSPKKAPEIIWKCLYCSSEHSALPCHAKRRKYCDIKCRDAHINHTTTGEYVCIECGVTFKMNKKIFERKSKLRNKGRVLCCSRECAHVYRWKNTPSTRVVRNCPICCKEFTVQRSIADKKGNYCSRDCFLEGKRRDSKAIVTLNCRFCGKEFKQFKSRINFRQGNGKYCSSKCRTDGIPSKYGNLFKRAPGKIKMRLHSEQMTNYFISTYLHLPFNGSISPELLERGRERLIKVRFIRAAKKLIGGTNGNLTPDA